MITLTLALTLPQTNVTQLCNITIRETRAFATEPRHAIYSSWKATKRTNLHSCGVALRARIFERCLYASPAYTLVAAQVDARNAGLSTEIAVKELGTSQNTSRALS